MFCLPNLIVESGHGAGYGTFRNENITWQETEPLRDKQIFICLEAWLSFFQAHFEQEVNQSTWMIQCTCIFGPMASRVFLTHSAIWSQMLSPWRSSRAEFKCITLDRWLKTLKKLIKKTACFIAYLANGVSALLVSSEFRGCHHLIFSNVDNVGAKRPSSTEDSKTVRRDRLLPVPPSSVSSSGFCNEILDFQGRNYSHLWKRNIIFKSA